jgi:RHS repeat-associated protein
LSESHQSDDEGLYGQFLCTATYFYDDNDRLREETKNGSVVTYTYDNNGNTLSRSVGTETVTYGYDYENRLVSVQGTGSATEYAYDADGIRVRSVTGGVVTNYLADKNRDYAQVLEERDSSGNITVSYVYGDDLISQKRSGSVSYYHYDGLGSTRLLTDAAGNVTDTYTYEAFGDLLHRTGTTENSYLFTGEQYDPNAGFYYLRARYYNPEDGRFITTDPWEGNISNPASLQKYIYVQNNPVIFFDPAGKFLTLIEFMAGIGLDQHIKRIDHARSIRQSRQGFRKYCKRVACTMDSYIKEYDMLRLETKGSQYAAHHIFQDADMKLIFGNIYTRGIGLAMPVLGKYGQKFSPHWILNRTQDAHRKSGDVINVARWGLIAAGCNKKDADNIVEFVEESFELMDVIF